jgi:hypothetical protein
MITAIDASARKIELVTTIAVPVELSAILGLNFEANG